MRGILLVTVGAILIGLGLFGTQEPGDPQGPTDPGRSTQVDSDGPGPVVPDGPRTSPPKASPTPAGGSGSGPEARPREDDRVAQVPAHESDAVTPVAVGGTPAHAPVQPASDPRADAPSVRPWSGRLAEPAAGDREPPVQEPEVDPDAPVFELSGMDRDRGILARTLLESWLARDQAPLQACLEEAHQAGTLPKARQDLVVAFWQAMVGRPEGLQETLEGLRGQDGVHSSQVALLAQALDPSGPHAVNASAGRNDALGHAMRMVLLEEEAARARRDGDAARTAVALSELLHAELGSRWWSPHREHLASWAEALREAQSRHRLSPKGAWPSHDVKIKPGGNLILARKQALQEDQDLLICVGLMQRVNELGTMVHPGDLVRCPKDTPNVLVDLDARLVVYRHGGEAVLAWPCGIGREGHDTPVGVFLVGEKLEDPVWYPGDGRRIAAGAPENLLGKRWIEWDLEGEGTSFGFHGTNDPAGVGQRVSSGCIRMLDEDVMELYELLPQGATVQVQP